MELYWDLNLFLQKDKSLATVMVAKNLMARKKAHLTTSGKAGKKLMGMKRVHLIVPEMVPKTLKVLKIAANLETVMEPYLEWNLALQ